MGKSGGKNDFAFSQRADAWRFDSVDLETIGGVSTGTLAILMSELGTGEQIQRNIRSEVRPSRRDSATCPNNKIIHARTRKVAKHCAWQPWD